MQYLPRITFRENSTKQLSSWLLSWMYFCVDPIQWYLPALQSENNSSEQVQPPMSNADHWNILSSCEGTGKTHWRLRSGVCWLLLHLLGSEARSSGRGRIPNGLWRVWLQPSSLLVRQKEIFPNWSVVLPHMQESGKGISRSRKARTESKKQNSEIKTESCARVRFCFNRKGFDAKWQFDRKDEPWVDKKVEGKINIWRGERRRNYPAYWFTQKGLTWQRSWGCNLVATKSKKIKKVCQCFEVREHYPKSQIWSCCKQDRL
jgi:hypothetical protein